MIARNFTDGTRLVVVKQPGGTSEALLRRNGKQISRVVIVPMMMRIGAAVVRMDGIGGVDTAEEYRHQGYARRVMETALERMRAGDAALSTLFGIQDFYQKFGFETAGPDYTVFLPLRDASAAGRSLPRGWRFRTLCDADMLAVKQLYHDNTRRAAGALIRHDAADDATETERLAVKNPDARLIGLRAWHRLQTIVAKSGEDACRVLLDDAGQVAAYAWFGTNWWMGVRRRDGPGAFHIAEAMARNPVAADALLAACRGWATEGEVEYEAVAFAIPPQGPLAWAAAYQGGRFDTSFTRGGDFMVRVLNPDALLRQMRPELTARVRAAHLPFRGQLTFATEEGRASLFITPSGVAMEPESGGRRLTVEMPQAILARLCLGGFDTDDVLARLPSTLAPEVVALLSAVFPRRYPHIYAMDRF